MIVRKLLGYLTINLVQFYLLPQKLSSQSHKRSSRLFQTLLSTPLFSFHKNPIFRNTATQPKWNFLQYSSSHLVKFNFKCCLILWILAVSSRCPEKVCELCERAFLSIVSKKIYAVNLRRDLRILLILG